MAGQLQTLIDVFQSVPPEIINEQVLNDIHFLGAGNGGHDYEQEDEGFTIFMREENAKDTKLPRFLSHYFGKGEKEPNYDGIEITYRVAAPAIKLTGYLGPTCRMVEKKKMVEVDEMVPTGRKIMEERKVMEVECD
jgi:hypothetical protein